MRAAKSAVICRMPMDDFSVDRPEINGALLSFEFGSGGRIHQIWAPDPADRDHGDEYPFVLSPMPLGEEFADDYFPGAILIGARTRPDDPWILSRNMDAEILDEADDPTQVSFEYEFSLLPEIGATGRFYEAPGPVPHIVWDVRIENRGRVSLEIGELAFPLAFNNLYEGFPNTQEGRRLLRDNRLVIHKSIAGSASFVHAQRLCGKPPGLLVVPGEDTAWEFFASVSASIKGPEAWAGIPIVYAHSKATVEREGWTGWFNGNSSLVMEPGDVRNYRTRFIPTDAADAEGAMATLAACSHPTISLFPGAVAPVEVGITVQVNGATPTQVLADREAELEAESEEGRGSCNISTPKAGPLRFSFEDTQGRQSHSHLLFIEPIEDLMKKRAAWICENQVVKAGPLAGAIVMMDLEGSQQLSDLDEFGSPYALESSLGDALFLAGKNETYPVDKEIAVLKEYVDGFIPRCIQNPGSGAVGFSFEEGNPRSINTGWPRVYTLLCELQAAMSRLFTSEPERAKHYREASVITARAFRNIAHPNIVGDAAVIFQSATWKRRHFGQFLGPEVSPDSASASGEAGPSERKPLAGKWQSIYQQRLMTSVGHDSKVPSLDMIMRTRTGASALPGPLEIWGPEGYADENALFKTSPASLANLAYTHRSLSPHWWWFGTDLRYLSDPRLRNRAMIDKGELCLGPTSPNNAGLGLHQLEHDAISLNAGQLRMAFGGLLGIWALVREDGAASAGFCPDPSSDQFGISMVTGDVGIGLYAYLQRAASYVVPAAEFAFGCFYEVDGLWATVTPWDGLGRKIVIGSYALRFVAEVGRIRKVRFRLDRSEATIELENPSDKPRNLILTVEGLWGKVTVVSGGVASESNGLEPGGVRIELESEANGLVTASMKGDVANS